MDISFGDLSEKSPDREQNPTLGNTGIDGDDLDMEDLEFGMRTVTENGDPLERDAMDVDGLEKAALTSGAVMGLADDANASTKEDQVNNDGLGIEDLQFGGPLELEGAPDKQTGEGTDDDLVSCILVAIHRCLSSFLYRT